MGFKDFGAWGQFVWGQASLIVVVGGKVLGFGYEPNIKINKNIGIKEYLLVKDIGFYCFNKLKIIYLI